MGTETVLFKSEERMTIQDVSNFLRELADKLAQGQVILRQGTQEIEISVPGHVELELKAEEELKKGKTQQSLEVEIAWFEGDDTQGPVELG
ncbi:MAG: amphi-Trp domain-containing protein [Anaerolineae bacterium]|nr:amphi-Trp domain-containing protein [Anaerolineae bacterium]